jgi:hypothetical protein
MGNLFAGRWNAINIANALSSSSAAGFTPENLLNGIFCTAHGPVFG